MQAESETLAATRWERMDGGIKEMSLVKVGFEAMFEGIKSTRKSRISSGKLFEKLGSK